MRRSLVIAAALFCATAAAQGGAWTLPQGHWQMFSSAITSSADKAFGDGGHSTQVRFSKTLVQNSIEYGLTNRLTLFVTPDYVMAREQTPTLTPTTADDVSVEAGARLLLLGKIGKLSLQASYKTAGAFDLSYSPTTAGRRDAGRQIELRLLYGTSFRFLGQDGFADVQAAQRWIGAPRPDETAVDLTLGWWLRHDTMLMAQNFNTVSAGDAKPPYTYYRSHKLAFSIVEKLSRHWSMQLGAFYSPAGQNALVERGIQMSLWTQD
jgi:hypothetical protein